MSPAAILAWRTARGLTQSACARLLGVDAVTVSRWERGHARPAPYLDRALRDLERELATQTTQGEDR